MAELQDQKLKIILNALKKEFNPLRVFLFGSRAADVDSTADSDYDFVVVVKETNKTRIENMRKARSIVREAAQVSADVFVYDQNEFNEYKSELSSIPETALNTGRELDLG
jgi:predicted nucleotidyltransferase